MIKSDLANLQYLTSIEIQVSVIAIAQLPVVVPVNLPLAGKRATLDNISFINENKTCMKFNTT